MWRQPLQGEGVRYDKLDGGASGAVTEGTRAKNKTKHTHNYFTGLACFMQVIQAPPSVCVRASHIQTIISVVIKQYLFLFQLFRQMGVT